MEEDDDNGTEIQGKWVRKHGYVSEFEIDARWVLYYPNDNRPQGSLRIVSHPDLPPGHLKSFVSIVIKRWPKTPEELAKTLENYGILNETDLFFNNGVFYKNKTAVGYYLYNNVIYRDKIIKKDGERTIISYANPVLEKDLIQNKSQARTQLFGDEFSVVTYDTPVSNNDLRHMLNEVFTELEAYTVNEHVESWDSESMDKMRNLEKLYNIKIFEQ